MDSLVTVSVNRSSVGNFQISMTPEDYEKFESGDLDEEAISQRWKNSRDSHMRARSTINRKSTSGSSADQRLRRNHRHYRVMTFLDRSLAARRTKSNFESSSSEVESPPRYPLLYKTPSLSRGRQGKPSSSRRRQSQLSLQDKALLVAIQGMRPEEKKEATPIECFCSRLADGLSKLPRRVSNQLQLEFLTKLVEEENKHLE